MNKLVHQAEIILESIEEPEAYINLMKGLEFLRSVQETTSNLVDNAIPPEGQAPSAEQVRTYFLALMVETAELLNELNWKTWKRSAKPIDKTKLMDEYADILAFLGIITVYMDRLGVTPEDVAHAYIRKTRVNVERFLGDY